MLFLKIIGFKSGRYKTQITCDEWIIGEDIQQPFTSTFTFNKSKIDADNFSLINDDDVIFIDAEQLDNTPFASGDFKPTGSTLTRTIRGGFCQQIESIEETEQEFIIRTKSFISNLDKTINLEIQLNIENTYKTYQIIPTLLNTTLSIPRKYPNSAFIKNPQITADPTDNIPSNPCDIFPTEPFQIYTLRSIFEKAIINNVNNFFFYQDSYFANNDAFVFNNRFIERSVAQLPPEVLNLNEDFINGFDLIYTSPNKVNVVVFYPKPENENYDYPIVIDYRESANVTPIYAEDYFSDSEIPNGSDPRDALKARASSFIDGTDDQNQMTLEMQVGIYDFFNLKLLRKFTLKYNDKTINTTLTQFSLSSDKMNKVTLTFGYKRVSLSSKVKDVEKQAIKAGGIHA